MSRATLPTSSRWGGDLRSSWGPLRGRDASGAPGSQHKRLGQRERRGLARGGRDGYDLAEPGSSKRGRRTTFFTQVGEEPDRAVDEADAVPVDEIARLGDRNL